MARFLNHEREAPPVVAPSSGSTVPSSFTWSLAARPQESFANGFSSLRLQELYEAFTKVRDGAEGDLARWLTGERWGSADLRSAEFF